jgi:hypothetical protein
MSAHARDYIPILTATQLSGLSKRNIYKLIEKQKIPFEEEQIGAQKRYKIPSHAFLIWLERYRGWYLNKAEDLRQNHQKLKEYLGV